MSQQPQFQLYVVVNSTFSKAYGPFADPGEAALYATEMTEHSQSGKAYVPVPLVTLGGVQVVDREGFERAQGGGGGLPESIKRQQASQYI